MTKQIEIFESVLCDRCSNAGRGVKLPGRVLCMDCIDDPELIRQIVLAVHPELAGLDTAIVQGLKP